MVIFNRLRGERPGKSADEHFQLCPTFLVQLFSFDAEVLDKYQRKVSEATIEL